MSMKGAKHASDRKLTLTPAHEAAKRRFNETGQSVAEWARKHGFHVNLVHEVLRGRMPKRGQSHRIAVLLGIKKGVIQQGEAK